jgi:hypothetical protein
MIPWYQKLFNARRAPYHVLCRLVKSSIGGAISLHVAAPIVREPGVKGVQILLVTGE